MLRSFDGRVLLAALALASASDAAKAPQYTVLVSTPNRAYTETPVSLTVPKPPAAGLVRVTDSRTKEVFPAQIIDGADHSTIWWLAADLPRGAFRTYRIAVDQPQPREPEQGLVKVDGRTDKSAVAITIDDQLFTRYCYGDVPKPYCYPVIGPTGAPVTRSYPMANVPGEPRDHPHQRSFWFTFGEVNGIDFWAEGPRTGKQLHREFQATAGGPVLGLLRALNDWVGPDAKKVCEDVRELRVYRVPSGRLFDFDLTLRATEGPVEFGDTKEGMLGFRIAASMRLAGGQGHIVNAAGQRDGDTWGKAAEWCDYTGPVNGETVGIAVFDHPQNLRHPTYWHVRDYGLFAANPFGLKDFIGDKTGAGRYTIPKGEALTFRYRVFIHRGTAEEAKVAERYGEYADPPTVELR